MTDSGNGEIGAGPISPRFDLLIQDTPSLDWVLAKYTDTWVTGDEMIRCPLPDHDDVDPSFNLWAPDDEGVPQMFGCFGCGRKGDVVELIAQMEHKDYTAALERAVELAREEKADTTPRERVRPERREVDHEAVLRQFVENFGPKQLAVMEKFLQRKEMEGGSELAEYLIDSWEWSADDRRVVMPHRDRDGKLTALKYRFPDGGRAAERPSSYPALYGAWRDKGDTAVLLCEGETDTAYAAWQLREDENVTVLGLPSGAEQKILESWTEQLSGRPLILAFDSDEPGMRAARRWYEMRQDALLTRLPENEDLLSSGIPVRELVARARSPRPASGMLVVNNGLLSKTSQAGPVPVADFGLRPTRELSTDEGPAWDVVMSGSPEKRLIRAGDLHTSVGMTRWSNRNGGSWFGTGTASQGLFNWLLVESSFLPLERATTKAGRIGRSFVGPGFCIGRDKYRYINPITGDPRLDSKLRIVEDHWDPTAILALERLNDPSTMATILGWLCATLLRGKRAPAPPLFVSGESGAGKTSMLSAVLNSFGFNTETNLTTTTPYGVDCMINSTIGFPVWFDEYRGGAREDSMSRLRQFLRDAYYGQPSLKGGMTAQATELSEISTWSGIVVSGEMSSRETSHRDRMIMLDLAADGRNEKALKYLQDSNKTRGLGYALLLFLATRSDTLFQVVPRGPQDAPPRHREALGFVSTGWDAWKHFRWEQGLRDTPDDPDFLRLAKERQESEDPWLEAIKACEGVTDRNGVPIVSREDSGAIIIPQEVIVEARRVGIELPARANELVQWLRNRYEVTDIRTVGNRRAKRVKGLIL